MLQIKTTTKTEQVTDIETPAYFKSHKEVVFINDAEMVKVNGSLLVVWKPGEMFFSENVEKVMQYEPATKEDFDRAIIRFLDSIGTYIPEHAPVNY